MIDFTFNVNDYNFNVEKVTNECIQWIKDWFNANGENCNAVIGISGGKDSSVVAALCVAALGRERVFGVLMPNGEQSDINYAFQLVENLQIRHMMIDISNAYNGVIDDIVEYFDYDRDGFIGFDISEQTTTNLPARIRMTTLYAVSQSIKGRVANTCNLSEDWVGYSTRYGDSVGDFSPLSNLTSDEVIAIGEYLGLPDELTHKVPSDGLCGKTDEDNLGFTYAVLNRYIRTGVCDDTDIKAKIDALHNKNLFKLQLMPSFLPEKEDYYVNNN